MLPSKVILDRLRLFSASVADSLSSAERSKVRVAIEPAVPIHAGALEADRLHDKQGHEHRKVEQMVGAVQRHVRRVHPDGGRKLASMEQPVADVRVVGH